MPLHGFNHDKPSQRPKKIHFMFPHLIQIKSHVEGQVEAYEGVNADQEDLNCNGHVEEREWHNANQEERVDSGKVEAQERVDSSQIKGSMNGQARQVVTFEKKISNTR